MQSSMMDYCLLTAILLGSGRIPQEADNRLCENLKVCYFSKYTGMNYECGNENLNKIYSCTVRAYKFTTIFLIVLYQYLRVRRVLIPYVECIRFHGRVVD